MVGGGLVKINSKPALTKVGDKIKAELGNIQIIHLDASVSH